MTSVGVSRVTMTELMTAIVISEPMTAQSQECERGDDDARGAADKIFRIPTDSYLVIRPCCQD